jgi:hypothetical protein
MANQANIANMISMFCVTYPNYKIDNPKATATVLLTVLGDLPADTLQSAVLQLVSEPGRQFAPSVGEIRGAAMKLNALASGIPDALTAYGEVVRMPANMTRSNVVYEDGMNIIEYHKLEWSHSFVGTVAELIGWPKHFPTDEAGVDRAQWVRFYDAELNRVMAESGRLPVVKDYIASKAGLKGLMPALGDVTKQLEVK